MTRVRWGILGTATIAREAVVPAMLKPSYREHLEIIGIASRDLAKAQAVAATFGIDRAFGSYESLLSDESVDAVYIPLPNHLHVPYAVLALEAGKHVLCEKPIALSANQAEELGRAAGDHAHLKIMEAFMYRHHPQWQWATRVIREGQIGDVRTVHSCFYFYDDNPAGILHHPEWGGGCLMDIGCYSVSLSRLLFQAEPVHVSAIIEVDPESGVDRSISGIMEFQAGIASFTCSTLLTPFQRVSVFGTRGRLELDLPFNPPTDRPHRALLEADGVVECIQFDICDQYGIQADLFSRAILEDTDVPTPIHDAIANMRVIEALARSGYQKCLPHAATVPSTG
jgi:predicted dehydrogenase